MSEDLPLGSRGGIAVRHNFPLDAEYTLRIRLQKNGYDLHARHRTRAPARRAHRRPEGQAVHRRRRLQGQTPACRRARSDQGDYERYLINADQHLELRFPAKAGTHLVQVTFPKRTAEPEGVYQPPVTDYSYALSLWPPGRGAGGRQRHHRRSYNAKGIGETPSRARIFICTPAECRRRSRVRQADSLHAGAPRVSPPGHRCGHPGRC